MGLTKLNRDLHIWSWLYAKKGIPLIVYLGVLIAFAALGFVAFSSEYRYVVYVEGLDQAAIDGNAKRAEWLLSHGADPNERDDNALYRSSLP